MIKPKVLLFSHEFPIFGGGSGVVAYQNYLALKEQGYSVTLLTRFQKEYPSGVDESDVISVRYIPKFWVFLYVLKILFIDLDVYKHIILNDLASGFIAGLSFGKDSLKKSTYFLHGSEPENIYNNPSSFYRVTRARFFYSRMLRHSKNIAAVSEYMKRKFISETAFNDIKKIKVIYSGISNIFFDQDRVDCQKVLDTSRTTILTVSRVEKKKGFLRMYKIFKNMFKANNQIIWIIVGSGAYFNELNDMIVRDNMDKNVLLVGKVDRSRLYYFYKCASVFWLLSEYKESFGLVYLEAQACGCPVIGYRKYGVKEAVVHEKTGYLIDNDYESIDIILSGKFLKLNREDLYEFSSNFVIDKTIQKLINIM